MKKTPSWIQIILEYLEDLVIYFSFCKISITEKLEVYMSLTTTSIHYSVMI